MVALFRRGELKVALLEALSAVEPANGYVIMQTVADRLEGAWQPSPGAVYPALLGLEDDGLIEAEDWDGTRLYRLTARGRRTVSGAAGTLAEVAGRTRTHRTSLGRILDAWVADFGGRDQRLDDDQRELLEKRLARIRPMIEELTSEVTGDG